ncbi:hypothetical protein J2Z58_001940 [Halobacillus andaensis]|nr:hypothetical protein [Halobacillus andaensis]
MSFIFAATVSCAIVITIVSSIIVDLQTDE